MSTLRLKATIVKKAGASYSFSAYLESRRFNAQLYNKVGREIVAAINEKLGEANTVAIEFSMSAKYQTPFVVVSGAGGNLWGIADVVAEILGEYFTAVDIDEDDYREDSALISFRD